MGSSAKKKRERKKDFQKTKLKVGKAKAKPANFTDTSFRSKSIVLNQQSLQISQPTPQAQFAHHLSLLTSHSDSQCRESLAYLTTASAGQSSISQPWSIILPKLLPLMTRASFSLRNQLIKLFRVIPTEDIKDNVQLFTTFIRSAMTSLSADIRAHGMENLSWLLEVAGPEVVSSRDGWTKILKCFVAVLGWDQGTGINVGRMAGSMKPSGDDKATAQQLQVLGQFLRHGIGPARLEDEVLDRRMPPLWYTDQHLLPRQTNCFAYLNLFGQLQDEEEFCEDRRDRWRIFRPYQPCVEAGLENSRKQGGEQGRVAGQVMKLLKENMNDLTDE